MAHEHLLSEPAPDMERARRALGRDIELVAKAQAGLFPRRLPVLETLSYAGVCLQAHQVGGDYYDFFSIGPGRLGFVLADVTGKGLGAALLMANLHGIIRSQFRLGRTEIAAVASLAHGMCLECWPEGTYATLFLGEYDDATRRLRYVNCGHPPALLSHADGRLAQLSATASVLGLFEDWECSTAEILLSPGDTLLLFSDGLMEARDAAGAEFGGARVRESLRVGAALPVSLLLESIVKNLSSVCQPGQDDLTLVALRCGEWHETPVPAIGTAPCSAMAGRVAD